MIGHLSECINIDDFCNIPSQTMFQVTSGDSSDTTSSYLQSFGMAKGTVY